VVWARGEKSDACARRLSRPVRGARAARGWMARLGAPRGSCRAVDFNALLRHLLLPARRIEARPATGAPVTPGTGGGRLVIDCAEDPEGYLPLRALQLRVASKTSCDLLLKAQPTDDP
jgi:hypothetical protein